MRTFTRFFASLLLLGASFFPTATEPPAAQEPLVVCDGISSEHVALVDWATELFAEAGLDLPPVRVTTSPDIDDCRGRGGMTIHHAAGSEIRLCGTEVGLTTEWLVLHELAHAWEMHTLTDAQRAAFLNLRGLDTWRDTDRWSDRGAEHAAEIMVWGLIDRPVELIRLDHTSCEELMGGYQLLTGNLPRNGYTDLCPGPTLV